MTDKEMKMTAVCNNFRASFMHAEVCQYCGHKWREHSGTTHISQRTDDDLFVFGSPAPGIFTPTDTPASSDPLVSGGGGDFAGGGASGDWGSSSSDSGSSSYDSGSSSSDSGSSSSDSNS